MSQRPADADFEVPCTVEVENTFEYLYAHVVLGEEVDIRPGDEVTVQGDPIEVGYGEHVTLERTAKIKQAGLFERAFTKLAGRFEFMELLEFSFTSGNRL